MSYQLTHISLYGIELDFEMARRLHFKICHEVCRKERKEGFPRVLEEWQTDEFQLGEYYDAVSSGQIIDTLFSDTTDIHIFFDSCNFSERQAQPDDIEKILSSFDEVRNIHYYRYRYYVDFFLKGGDTRGDSTRFAEGKQTVFRVYIASNGYAYTDDLAHFNREGRERYMSNFNKYCKPRLEKIGISTPPSLMEIEQTW